MRKLERAAVEAVRRRYAAARRASIHVVSFKPAKEPRLRFEKVAKALLEARAGLVLAGQNSQDRFAWRKTIINLLNSKLREGLVPDLGRV